MKRNCNCNGNGNSITIFFAYEEESIFFTILHAMRQSQMHMKMKKKVAINEKHTKNRNSYIGKIVLKAKRNLHSKLKSTETHCFKRFCEIGTEKYAVHTTNTMLIYSQMHWIFR